MNAPYQALALSIAERHEKLVKAIATAGGLTVDQGEDLIRLYELVGQLVQLPNAQPGGEPPPVFEPFAPMHKFAYLPDALSSAQRIGFFTPFINNGGPRQDVYDLAQISSGDYVGVDAAAEWGEHGPKWGARIHRATGRLAHVGFSRIGDFTRGREGHALYFSPARGDLTIEDVYAHGCGGHHSHIRSFSVDHDPDGMLPELLPRPEDLMLWRNCSAYQCDAIVAGDSPRASWTFHIANPGGRARLEACTVTADHTARGDGPGSTGALLLGFDQEPRRCPLSETFDFVVDLTRSDRALIWLEGQDESRHEDLDLLESGRPARVRIVDGCGPVHLLRPKQDVLVEFVPRNDESGRAYREPYRTELVSAGTAHWMFGGVA